MSEIGRANSFTAKTDLSTGFHFFDRMLYTLSTCQELGIPVTQTRLMAMLQEWSRNGNGWSYERFPNPDLIRVIANNLSDTLQDLTYMGVDFNPEVMIRYFGRCRDEYFSQLQNSDQSNLNSLKIGDGNSTPSPKRTVRTA